MPCLACVLLMLLAGAPSGREGLAVGIILGEPTGVSLKTWIDDKTAVDGAAAWSFSDHGSFQLHADYLVHSFDKLAADDLRGPLPLYVGIGARVRLNEKEPDDGDGDISLGVRIPLGFDYLPSAAPVDVFLEFVPILELIPGTEFDLAGAFGARFHIP